MAGIRTGMALFHSAAVSRTPNALIVLGDEWKLIWFFGWVYG